ncbi:hypothetical protein ABIC65_001079 [Sphingomonas trueperi]|uniref:hypothetical protein n=1 Tax=Sphingomonas trueperi TaxID=53317 RepID=UPI00339B0F90
MAGINVTVQWTEGKVDSFGVRPMTPLERAKAAVKGALEKTGTPYADYGEDWEQDDFELIARAAIEAIREPSEGMVEAGAGVIPCAQGAEQGPENTQGARDCHRAMIGALLEEGGKSCDHVFRQDAVICSKCGIAREGKQ